MLSMQTNDLGNLPENRQPSLAFHVRRMAPCAGAPVGKATRWASDARLQRENTGRLAVVCYEILRLEWVRTNTLQFAAFRKLRRRSSSAAWLLLQVSRDDSCDIVWPLPGEHVTVVL